VVLTSFDLSSTKFFVWSVVWGPYDNGPVGRVGRRKRTEKGAGTGSHFLFLRSSLWKHVHLQSNTITQFTASGTLRSRVSWVVCKKQGRLNGETGKHCLYNISFLWKHIYTHTCFRGTTRIRTCFPKTTRIRTCFPKTTHIHTCFPKTTHIHTCFPGKYTCYGLATQNDQGLCVQHAQDFWK